jgi:general secretion pathway protein F
MKTPCRHTLPDAGQYAQLFLHLAHLENSGIPAAEAFTMIAKTQQGLPKGLKTMPNRLKAGQAIAEAGFKAGLFDSNHRALVAAAEQGGKLAPLYRQLAGHYGNRAKRQKKMRSRLSLPGFVLAASLFIQPLPALITTKISLGEYLFASAGSLLILAAGISLLIRLPHILAALGLTAQWHNVQCLLPPVAKWLTQRQLNHFFFLLAMLLEAGMDFANALPNAVASISNTPLRGQFAPALARMKTGASAAQVLGCVPSIPASTLQIINSGEQSGRLADTLRHFTEIDASTLALQDEALAEWVPRLVYTAIGLWMGYGILSQGLPLPSI